MLVTLNLGLYLCNQTAQIALWVLQYMDVVLTINIQYNTNNPVYKLNPVVNNKIRGFSTKSAWLGLKSTITKTCAIITWILIHDQIQTFFQLKKLMKTLSNCAEIRKVLFYSRTLAYANDTYLSGRIWRVIWHKIMLVCCVWLSQIQIYQLNIWFEICTDFQPLF